MKHLATTLLLLLALGGNTAFAAHGGGNQGDGQMQKKARTKTLDQATAQVRRQTGGRILSAKTVTDEDGRKVHRIKVLTQERKVRVLTFPAE
jgi:uncharacterized membrane protein YkoI